jgi:hypothetical protein
MEMNRKDRQAAEQLDRYIDAAQRGKETSKGYPFVDRLLAVAESIEAGPSVEKRIKHSMSAETVVRRRFRWAGVAAALALVVLAFATVPPLRGLARDIVNVFAVQRTDQDPGLQPTIAPPEGVSPEEPSGPNASEGLSLEQVKAQVAASADITFDVITPEYVPAGFSFDAGMVDEFGRMVVLTYVSVDRLSLFDVRMYDLANPNPAVDVEQPLGASSTIEAVTVRGEEGQYVRGAYGADGTWDAKAPVQTLAWRGGDVLYMITTYEQGPKIPQGDLMAIAESIGR